MDEVNFPITIAVHGCTGRVGKRLLALLSTNSSFKIVGAYSHYKDSDLGQPITRVDGSLPVVVQALKITTVEEITALSRKPNVIIDFSSPKGTERLLKVCCQYGICVVIGTTGFTEDQHQYIKESAKQIPIVLSSNFSLGINLLKRITYEVTKALSKDFDVEIVETHHNKKKDSPSGTALMLAESVASAKQRPLDIIYGRNGMSEKLTHNELGIHSLRLGSIVGDHTVHFASDFERIQLTHQALTRDVFAAGAIRAAAWVVDKQPSLYSMDHVLFGKDSSTFKEN